MGRSILVFLVVIASAALADASGDATAKLQAKKAAQDAAASQPSGLTKGQVEDLRREIARLRYQVSQLESRITALTERPTSKPAKQQAKAKSDDDGPGTYRVYYLSSGGGGGGTASASITNRLTFDVQANNRAAAIKIAIASGVHPETTIDRDGNEHVICEKIK